MCKIWSFRYSCPHLDKPRKPGEDPPPAHELRLCKSACRETRKLPKSKIPFCCKRTSLRIKILHPCGSCALEMQNEALDREQKTLELEMCTEASMDTFERQIAEIAAKKALLDEQYPSLMNWHAPTTPRYSQKPGEKSRTRPRKTSLLSKEVMPEDVPDPHPWDGGSIHDGGWQFDTSDSKPAATCVWEDWGPEYKKLGEEIDEDKASRAVNGLEVSWLNQEEPTMAEANNDGDDTSIFADSTLELEDLSLASTDDLLANEAVCHEEAVTAEANDCGDSTTALADPTPELEYQPLATTITYNVDEAVHQEEPTMTKVNDCGDGTSAFPDTMPNHEAQLSTSLKDSRADGAVRKENVKGQTGGKQGSKGGTGGITTVRRYKWTERMSSHRGA